MKILVTGAEGQLGTDVCNAYAGEELFRADLDGNGYELDITDQAAVNSIIHDINPDVVINCAAAHNVLHCEQNPDVAFHVNATGSRYLAVASKAAGARLVHVSTDYVFGHGGTRPYVEADMPAPLSVYAASKLAGEHLIAAYCPDHIIVRTAAIYGAAPCRAKGGKNFVQLMLHLASTKPEVRVVTDEITTPTYTASLAKQMKLLAEKADPGVYHTTCQGQCAWFDFAQAIFEETDTEVNLREARADEFQSEVMRPNYSVLENKRAQDLGLDIMPPWRDGLKEYLSTHG